MYSRKKVMLIGMLLVACFSWFNFIQAQESSSQKLTGVLPDNVLVFATTSGGDALKGDFQNTALSRIMEEPSVKAFYESVEKSLLELAQKESAIPPEATGLIGTVKSVISLVGSRPIVLGIAQKEVQDGPPVYGFAIIDGSSKKDQIDGFLKNLEATAGNEIIEINIGSQTFHGPRDDGGVPGYWGWVDNYFVFAINDGDGLALKYLDGKIKRESFSYFQESSVKNDAFAVYVNIEKGLDIVKAVAKMQNDAPDFAMIEEVLSKLGLDKIKTLTSRIGFEGNGLIEEDLLSVTTPLTGLFANIKPISIDTFNMVNSDAVSITAMNCDMAGIYDTVMSTAKDVAGDEFAQVEQGIAQMEQQMQIKIRDGLLESLNGKILFYEVPSKSALQGLQSGFVVVLGLKDVDLWNQNIAAISQLAATMSNNMVQLSSQEMNGRTMNTIAIVPLAMAQVMPTWTIVGDNVVIGSSPAICSAAAEQAAPAARAKSIRSDETFKKLTANLPSDMIGLRYVDSRAQMAQVMALLQQYWPVATMYVAQQGIQLPVVIPDLSNIIENISPSIEYSWIDEKGIHSIYKGSGIEQSIGAVVGGAVGAGAATMR